MEDVEVLKRLKMKRPTFKVGSVGPYNIRINSLTTLVEDDKVSDEVMDSICDVLSRIRPGVVHINSQALTKILDGSKRAKSHYFIKNNIFEGTTEVFGPYLEGGNHWTFFHCNVDKRCITYFNSFGEMEWQCQAIAQHWCDFATARGVQGEWVLKTTKHSLQTDSVSCGVHTLAFATEFIKSGGCITSFQCPAIQQERTRLALLLYRSLDRTKTCGICSKNVLGRKRATCTCGAVLHLQCAATPVCYICQDDSNSLSQISLPTAATSALLADTDLVEQFSRSAECSALQQGQQKGCSTQCIAAA
ncbi:uncharacterized protein [Paramisgurnus dabryanus]|uniref:uncharacterized protein n=1 Tax=Paramisgurnus dabryanus TaxID=90735 RepID=UPI0031F41878